MDSCVEVKAATFAIRLPEADEVESAEIYAWVAQDPKNAVAFARAESAWNDAERLKACGFEDPSCRTETAVDERRKVSDGAVRPEKTVTRRGLVLAACCAVALLGAIPTIRTITSGSESFSTQTGEVREVALSDGSTVHINTDSEIRVEFTEDRRLLRLVKGEASFDVFHDKTRPFDVVAGDTVTRAVGTRFTIREAGDEDVQLTVEEGLVLVSGGGGHQAHIAAGHGAHITSGQIATAALDPRSLDQRTLWHEGMLEFDGLTISQAVDEFNRYRRVPLVVKDPAIGALRIGGRFGIGESDKFIEALQSGFGVRVTRGSGGVIEIGKAN